MKKLHLKSKGDTAFAKNFIDVTKTWNKNLENLDFIEEPTSVESSSKNCKSKSPISRDSDENKS